MEIKQNGSRPSVNGPAEWFTGIVHIETLHQAPAPGRVGISNVTFEAGARTAWHSHPLGQTLIVTAGSGLAQSWGQSVKTIQPGDVVWFQPGEKHWHGAAPTTAMTHISIVEWENNTSAEWMEHVNDEQYKSEMNTSQGE